MAAQATNDRAPAAHRRGRSATLMAAALLGASFAVSACGSSGSPTILNTEKVERAIEASSMSQRHKRVHVSCPSGVHQKKGLVFDCVTMSPHGRTRFVVTELDDAGHVHYQAP